MGAPQLRRTQDERSTAMRERLLDATIDCLVEYGYIGTTVTRIAERAGVTRGAQVHHYRTKNDLVAAAVKHLAGSSAELGWRQITAVVKDQDPVGSLLDLLWDLHSGPSFTATVELWVAARTDPELRTLVGDIEPVLLSSLRTVSIGRSAIDTPAAVDEQLLGAVYTAMDVMRGQLISAWHLPDRQRDARWRRARESLRVLFPSDTQVRAILTSAAVALPA